MQLPVIPPCQTGAMVRKLFGTGVASAHARRQGYHIILMSLSKQARNDQANQTENIRAPTLYVAQAFCEVPGPENHPHPKSGYLK